MAVNPSPLDPPPPGVPGNSAGSLQPSQPAPSAAAPAPAEPGYTTTEFWIAVPVSLVGLLVTLGVIQPRPGELEQIAGLCALVAPSIAYSISRAIRKQGSPG